MEVEDTQSWLLEKLDSDGFVGVLGPYGVLPVLQSLSESVDGLPVGAVPFADVDAVVGVSVGHHELWVFGLAHQSQYNNYLLT